MLERYSEEQKKIIKQYFDCLKDTRKTGKISDNIIRTEIKYWEKFSVDVVMEALRVHIQKYPSMRETYTRGIMRNLEMQGFQQKNRAGYTQLVHSHQGHTEDELQKELLFLSQKRQGRTRE